MNGDFLMLVKTPWRKCKIENNLSIFCVEIGEKKSIIMTHVVGNLQINPILCKLSLKSKNVTNFEKVAICFDIFK